jgi:hypothetical protein
VLLCVTGFGNVLLSNCNLDLMWSVKLMICYRGVGDNRVERLFPFDIVVTILSRKVPMLERRS